MRSFISLCPFAPLPLCHQSFNLRAAAGFDLLDAPLQILDVLLESDPMGRGIKRNVNSPKRRSFHKQRGLLAGNRSPNRQPVILELGGQPQSVVFIKIAPSENRALRGPQASARFGYDFDQFDADLPGTPRRETDSIDTSKLSNPPGPQEKSEYIPE